MIVEWYVIAGILLVTIAFTGTLVERVALTPALIYLGVGALLGPWVIDVIRFPPVDHPHVLERLAEGAVVLSLLGAGLRLRVPIRDRRWWLPVRLAFVSMVLTIGLIAALAMWLFDLPLGVAILLGAILAPTDPVLASEVQVDHPGDRDRLRFSLTAEAGLNDGSAFPFVFLGLGLMELHELGAGGSRWVGVNLLFEPIGGLVVGGVLATVIGRAVLALRRRSGHGVGLDGFLMLGVAAIVYGVALATHTSGFLAAFAAGLGLRRIELRESGDPEGPATAEMERMDDDDAAVHPEHAPTYLAHALLDRNAEVERLAELGLVILVGVMLAEVQMGWREILFAAALIVVIRPLATLLSLVRSRATSQQRRLIGWFGLRGIGSLYYLGYALNHGVAGGDAANLVNVTLVTVATSVVVHGISVTPLLNRYRAREGAASARPAA